MRPRGPGNEDAQAIEQHIAPRYEAGIAVLSSDWCFGRAKMKLPLMLTCIAIFSNQQKMISIFCFRVNMSHCSGIMEVKSEPLSEKTKRADTQ